MRSNTLGELKVGRIGLGTMGMSAYYTMGERNEKEALRTIHRAIELGVNLFDTAEVYGPFTNEALLGKALQGRRDQVVLATKFGLISHAAGGSNTINSKPGNIRIAVEGSLRRLNTDHIDLYYQHRVDPRHSYRRYDRPAIRSRQGWQDTLYRFVRSWRRYHTESPRCPSGHRSSK